MKVRKLPLFIIIALCAVLIFALSACGDDNLCHLRFYADGKLVADVSVEKGGLLDEIPDVPEKDGYAGSWSVSDFDEINESMRIYAIYVEAYFTVTFTVDGEVYETRTVRKNSTLSNVPNVPEKHGYSGVWSVTDFTDIDRTLTVEAIYTDVQATVRFMVGENEYALRYADIGGSVVEVPAVPAAQGKNLSGKWVIKRNGVDEDADFNKIDGDTTVYAHYYVTLGLNGGQGTDKSVAREPDETVQEPLAGEIEGYSFLGWYADPDFRVKYNFPMSFSENAELYARWADNSFDEGFTFENGAITGYTGTATDVKAPFKYLDGGEERIVVKVAEGAFKNSGLTSIVLPSTVEIIEESAFENSRELISVAFADGSYVERIERNAFKDCVYLKGFEFAKFTEFIGESAFDNCLSAVNYNFAAAENLKEIGARAFADNSAAESFVFSEKLEKIGAYAFAGDINAEFDFSRAAALAEVGEYAFKDCARMRSFDVRSLSVIGDGAFSGCYSLNAVTVPADKELYTLFGEESGENYYTVNVDGRNYSIPAVLHSATVAVGAEGKIKDGAFFNCVSVKSVYICEGITSIGERAFSAENVIDGAFEVFLPATITEIGNSAFRGRNDLTALELPSSVRKIGAYAFYGIENLTSVSIGINSALSEVGEYAFGVTGFLRGYIGVARIGRVALGISDEYISSTGRINLFASDFDGIDTISPKAFANNTRLRSIELGAGILTVGDGAFSDIETLEEIAFNTNCTVAEGALSGCYNLKKITLGGEKRVEELFGMEINGSCSAYVKGEKTYYISPNLRSITVISDGVTEIKPDIYVNFDTVEEIEIGEGFTVVYDGAFKNNANLKSVKFPASLTAIGAIEDGNEYEGVFLDSPKLETATAPYNSNLTHIYDKVFKDTALKEFTVPAKTEYIGESAFENTKLERLGFSEGEKELSLEKKAFFSSKGYSGATVVFPDRLVKIAEKAFAECDIGGVVLNDGLRELGEYAFENCGIKTLSFPASVKIYDENSEEKICLSRGAFKGNNIESLTMNGSLITMEELFDGNAPDSLFTLTVNAFEIVERQFENLKIQELILNGVKSIGNYAFYRCADLLRVTVPAETQIIGDYAFSECKALIGFVFAAGSEIRSLGKYAFAGDTDLRQVALPDGLTDTEFIGTFADCEKLAEANVPDSVKVLGEEAFKNNASLKKAELPTGLEIIGDYAFYGCGNLEFEDIKFDSLTEIGDYAFAGCALLSGLKAESIVTIGDYAFDGCLQMKEITVIDKKVKEYISDVSHVVAVSISAAAQNLAENVFEDCVNLGYILVYTPAERIDGMITALQNRLFVNSVKVLDAKVFVDGENMEALSDGVKNGLIKDSLYLNPSEINGAYEFDENTKTAKLVAADCAESVAFLPAYIYKEGERYEVVEIGFGVFRNDEVLKEVIIPFTVEKIDDSAFANSKVESVSFEVGSRLKTVERNAFYNCGELKKLSLPDSLERIEYGAFFGTTKLASLEFGALSKLNYVGEYSFAETSALDGVRFFGTDLTVDKNAFSRSGIKALSFGSGMKKLILADYSFSECYSLVDISVPDFAEVGNNAFVK